MFLKNIENVLKAVVAGSAAGVALLGFIVSVAEVLPVTSMNIIPAHMYGFAIFGALVLSAVTASRNVRYKD